MATTVKIPSTPRKLRNVGVALRKELKDIGDDIKEELSGIVAPFQSNVDVVAVTKRTTTEYTIEIMGNPNDVATVNAAGDGVSSHDLIKFLDGGTNTQYVGMPEGFSNETTPNSKDTSSREYDREGVYFKRNPTSPGIAARNWFKLLMEDYKPQVKQRFSRTTRSYLN